jgi:hypothetical protein
MNQLNALEDRFGMGNACFDNAGECREPEHLTEAMCD